MGKMGFDFANGPDGSEIIVWKNGSARPATGVEIGLIREINRLQGVLAEIAKGEGRYSREPLEHASNTVEDMKALAASALRAERAPEPEEG